MIGIVTLFSVLLYDFHFPVFWLKSSGANSKVIFQNMGGMCV